jgi:hypothetical protein
MHPLRLKEDPREWRTFSLSLAGAMALVAGLIGWRKGMGPGAWVLVGAALTLAVLAGVAPGRLRPVYRTGMRVGFFLGRIVGAMLLTVVYGLVVIPLGWVLRWSGRDLLELRRNPTAKSYWKPARRPGPLDRMF